MYESAAHRTTQLGPYRSLAPLWRGKTSDFFLATDSRRADLRKFVIKRLRAELLDDADFCATFLHQATIAIDLRHPNVVECYEALDDGGAIALVMEFLDGQSLARIRQRRHVVTAVPTPIHLRVLADVLDALHYLHGATSDRVPSGIIHGDVRPDNVFVTNDGRTKLLHAGIENAEATTGIIREKLSYMSPERARGGAIDRRSDLFSVGVMLWEAATGLRFWQDWPDVAIFRRLCAEGVPLQSGWVPISAREVFAVATRAIAVNPDDRYQSAAEMKEALLAVLAGSASEASTDAIRAYMAKAFSGQGNRAVDLDLAAVELVLDAGDDDEAPTTLRLPPESIAPLSNDAPHATTTAPRRGTGDRRVAYVVLGMAGVVLGGALFGRALAERHGVPSPARTSDPRVSALSSSTPTAAPASSAAPAYSTVAVVAQQPPPIASCLPVVEAAPGNSAGHPSPSKNRMDRAPKPGRPATTNRDDDIWGI